MTRETDAYDWNRRGRHRLRAPAAVVIDLPVPAASSGSQRSGRTSGPVDGLERSGSPSHRGMAGVSRWSSPLAT